MSNPKTLEALIKDYAAENITFDEVLAGAKEITSLSTTETDETYNTYNGESWESDPQNSLTTIGAYVYTGHITRDEYNAIVTALLER